MISSDQYKYFAQSYQSKVNAMEQAQVQYDTAINSLTQIVKEQELIEQAVLALNAAKPLLAAHSIKQCEELANSAISVIFGFPYTVEYSPENQRFLLNKGDYKTDLADAEGGGLVTVIGFVLNLYLLVKLGKRRFLAYDEAFTQVSDAYFPAFVSFIRQVCKDLNVDLLLISHDARIQLDDVDNAYMIENGHSKKLK